MTCYKMHSCTLHNKIGHFSFIPQRFFGHLLCARYIYKDTVKAMNETFRLSLSSSVVRKTINSVTEYNVFCAIGCCSTTNNGTGKGIGSSENRRF